MYSADRCAHRPGLNLEANMETDTTRWNATNLCRRGIALFSALPLRSEAEARSERAEIAQNPKSPSMRSLGDLRRELFS